MGTVTAVLHVVGAHKVEFGNATTPNHLAEAHIALETPSRSASVMSNHALEVGSV